MNRYIKKDEFEYDGITSKNSTNPLTIITMKDTITNNIYICSIEKNRKSNTFSRFIWIDPKCNKFDFMELIFNNDIDMYDKIPKELVTYDINETYNNYYPGRANRFIYDSYSDYQDAYNKEENRCKKLVLK